MNTIWKSISYLGLKDTQTNLSNRSIILANQLNFILLIIMLGLGITTSMMALFFGGPMSMGSFRVFFQFFVHLIIFVLAYYGFFTLVKLALVFLPAFVLILIPTFTGFVETEGFVYYPVAIIGLSLVSQLIWIPKFNLVLYILSLVYFFILLCIIFNLLVFFSPVRLKIIDLINEFRLYYQLIPIVVFFFLHLAIFYLRRLNYRFEHEITDYTQELNSAIKELKLTQQQLVQSEKMASLGTLTAGVAHEMNNPLNFIHGGLLILDELHEKLLSHKDQTLKERCESAIEIIDSGVQRATGIVSSLMTFSYRGTPKLIPVNMTNIINQTFLFLSSKLTPDIRIIKNLKLESEIPVIPDKIHQVILNVLDNAIYSVNQNKSSNEKIIAISTEKKNSYAVITISNNGPKIPEQKISQIFDPFFTTKDPGTGTGLGLSICYSLIEEHKGNITAHNTDEGVSFVIKLPVK